VLRMSGRMKLNRHGPFCYQDCDVSVNSDLCTRIAKYASYADTLGGGGGGPGIFHSNWFNVLY
jgi:hypothetical protein